MGHERGKKNMAEVSLPQATSRVQRGVALYWRYRESTERTGPSSYLVPSCSGEGHYSVELGLQYCSCPDHQKAKELDERCKHVIAATIYRAKSRAARKR